MDSIIFDLDGTLWDSIDTIFLAQNCFIKDQGQISKTLTRANFEGAMCLQIDKIGMRFFPKPVTHTGHSF